MSTVVMQFTIFALACLTITALALHDDRSGSQQRTLHRRDFFYVGGEFIKQGTSTLGHGQMYVEHLAPAKVTKSLPLLFIEGMGMSGTNLLNTPDGRGGWADYFMSKGYELYIVDQPARARSPWMQSVDGVQITFDVTYVESHFTSPERYNLWPQAHLHTQWPGNGSLGDTAFEQFYKATHPSLNATLEESNLIKAAASQLINKIGDVVLLCHSQSGQFCWTIGDANPKKVKGIIGMEPTGPPMLDAVFTSGSLANPTRPYGITVPPIEYDPPLNSPSDLKVVVVSSDPAGNYTCYKQAEPAKKLANLSKIPILMVTSESSFHAVYDGCTAEYLSQAGVKVEHIRLENVGIHGNGHMMFMEKNNLQIAEEVVERWLDKTFADQ